MVVGNVPTAVDLVVVGGGPGGYAAALHAAHLGRQVLLVDADGDEGLGGVCLRVGCIPSKAMIEAADLHHRIPHAEAMGVRAERGAFDMAQFQIWKAKKVGGLTSGVRGLLKAANVSVKRGHLRFTAPGTAVISDGDGAAEFINYKDIILATGSRPVELGCLPFDGEFVLSSTDALELDKIPDSVAVIGAGYVGVELGTALAKLGAKVSLIEAAARVLPAMDASLSRPVARRLKELDVDVRVNTLVTGHEEGALTIESNGQSERLDVACAIVAIGRKPNTDDLELPAVGVEAGEAGLLSPAEDRSVAPHIYAIGDITPGPALAHKAIAEALVAARAACGQKDAFEPQAIPAIVFSDPEVASVGLSEDEARSLGADVQVTTIPLTASGRAATLDQRLGFATCVADTDDGAVLGIHMVGPHASELIAEATLAIEMGVTLEDLALTIHPHPTLSEQLAELSHLALGMPVHAPLPKR